MIRKVFLDILFYLVVPLIVWNFFREFLGDYYAILFGLLPALVYTVVIFVLKREWNVTGIFFLSLISLHWLFNILSTTAIQELWNAVYISSISILFYLFTIFIKKPIGMYFFIDYAYARGVPREISKEKYRHPLNYHHFVLFTLFLVIRDLVVGGVRFFLIDQKGISGVNTIYITNSILEIIFTCIMIIYIMYIVKNIKNTTQ